MSRSKNTIKFEDTTTTPIRLRYSASYTRDRWASLGITLHSGSNGPVSTTGSVPGTTLNYRFLRQLYYQNYLTGSVMVTASYWNWNQQSTACSGSSEYENRYYPTESNVSLRFIAIPSSVFGEQISPESFYLKTPTKEFIDDGNGNVFWTGTNPYDHVGNIIYSQGICVFTNKYLLDEDPFASNNVTMSFNSEVTVYQNQYRCKVDENDFNCTTNPSANKNGMTGSYIDEITGSEFRPYATCVGLYNDRDELLVVGKLATPYPIPSNTDMTFVVRWDS